MVIIYYKFTIAMQFACINNIIVHYKWVDAGRDKTFVFINSLGTDFRIWQEVVDKVEAFGNVLLYDKRGHGLTDTANDTKGLEDYAEDLWHLINYLSIETCVVVGLSVGGIIAQILAYHHPERIEKLILCDTRHKIGIGHLWDDRIFHIKQSGITNISEDLMKRWFAPSFHREHPEKVAGYKNMLERMDVRGYVQTCEAIRDADTTEIAKRIAVPVLCHVGSEDRSTPPEELQQLSALIQGACYKVIQGSGHLPCVDNPIVLSKLILDFIKT